MDFIKEKKTLVIDEDKFHIGCAYFVQSNELGGSWFVGILDYISEDALDFVVRNSNITKHIILDELLNPYQGYKITMLVPGWEEDLITKSKIQDPDGFDKYLGGELNENRS